MLDTKTSIYIWLQKQHDTYFCVTQDNMDDHIRHVLQEWDKFKTNTLADLEAMKKEAQGI